MQRVLCFLLVLLVAACQKEKLPMEMRVDREVVKNHLQAIVPAETLAQLDWSKYGPLQKNGETMAIKIPMKGANPDLYSFLVVNIKNEQPTTVYKNDIQYLPSGPFEKLPQIITNFNYQTGKERVYNLTDDKQVAVSVTPLRRIRPRTLVESGSTLPIVTIIGTYGDGSTGTSLSGTAAYVMAGIMGVDGASGGTSGEGSNYSGDNYTNLDYLDPLSGGSTGGSSTSLTYQVIEWEMDDSIDKVGVDISKYLNCFGNIPDAGATYSVKVMVDIPVDDNPNSLINIGLSGLSVGHVFLSLTKTNGNQQVSQTLGFYPATDYKSLTLSPVTSKIVDDAVSPGNYHEYNASLSINNFTSAEFNSLLLQLKLNSTLRYEIDGFNCANFVGSSLNAVRPGTLNSYATTGINPLNLNDMISVDWSPNGVYKALLDKKAAGGTQAQNIETSVVKLANQSSGACN